VSAYLLSKPAVKLDQPGVPVTRTKCKYTKYKNKKNPRPFYPPLSLSPLSSPHPRLSLSLHAGKRDDFIPPPDTHTHAHTQKDLLIVLTDMTKPITPLPPQHGYPTRQARTRPAPCFALLCFALLRFLGTHPVSVIALGGGDFIIYHEGQSALAICASHLQRSREYKKERKGMTCVQV